MFRQLLFLAVIFISSLTTIAQNNVRGSIITSDGDQAALVSIAVRELSRYTTSDSHGSFEVKDLAPGTYTLVISFTGLQTQEKKIEVNAHSAAQVHFILVENAMELQEVIVNSRRSMNNQPVSAGKININPMDLPQSLSIIGQSTIRDQQSLRLSGVIRNVNGVYVSTTRGNTQESFSARGYGFSSTNMFKNGSRVNSGVIPEIGSLEKVEVLKGSASILYGNVSPGGIINMVTKQPRFNYGAEFSFRTGSSGLLKPAFDVYGPISKKIAFRVNGTYEKADSYRDVVQTERFYVNPSMLFKLGKQTDLLVQGDFLDHHFTPDFGIGSLDNTMIPDVKRSAFFGTSWQYNHVKQATTTASLKHRFSKAWSVNISSSYQLYKRDYYSIERLQAKANGDWARPLNRLESQEDYLIGQVDLTGKFKTGKIEHSLLAGIDADRYFTTAYTFNNPTIYDTINILDPQKFVARTDIPDASKITRAQTPINRIGLYVQDLLSISPAIKLLVGLRWSEQNNRPVNTNYLLKDSVAKTTTRIDNAITPRVGLVYKPLAGMSAFASYSQSFVPNNNPNGNPLEPSMIDQFEVGLKNEFLKGKLTANLVVYRIVNNNLASVRQFNEDGTPNNNLNLKELTGETTSDGLEIDISSQPVPGLQVIAGYSYNNMRYTKVKEGKGNYIEGERLVNTPAHTANSSVFYVFPNGKAKGWKLGASVFYIGNRFGGWNNTQQQTQTYSRLIPVDGFTTVDLSAGYTYRKFSFLAKVSNLFNSYNYYVHENYSVNPIAPTQFSATLSMKL